MSRLKMHVFFAVVGCMCLVNYVLTVLLLGETVAGIDIGMVEWFGLEVATLTFCIVLLRGLAQKRIVGPVQLLGLGVVTGTLSACLVLADVGVFLLTSTTTTDPGRAASLFDENPWIEESYPRRYYPTKANFVLHKPSFSVQVSNFGWFYRPYMLASPTLVSEVLEKQDVKVTINELGFREEDPIDSCAVFALGDSFTFGFQVTDSRNWPDRLQSRTGQCVYNLGVNDASPKQGLELLKHVLSEHSPQIEHLIWLIYEGNDLEDSFAEERPELTQPSLWDAVEATVFGGIVRTIVNLKQQSVIDRLREGDVRMDLFSKEEDDFQYVVDGIQIFHPIVHSETHGYLLLYEPYVRRAYAEASYFKTHPNANALQRVFKEMRSVSLDNDFTVTVVTAPTSITLYAPHFGDLAALPIERHLAQMVEMLADANEFAFVDLFPMLAPIAQSEMLYFRDDTHWNSLGHDTVAELLARISDQLTFSDVSYLN